MLYTTNNTPIILRLNNCEDRATPTFKDKIDAVRVVRSLYGREQARAFWRQMNLPAIDPPPATGGPAEALACLAHLLLWPALSDRPVRDLIDEALAADENARLILVGAGIRIYDDKEGILVMSACAQIVEAFAGSPWDHGRYVRVLRRLPGAKARTCPNSTWIPGKHLDLDPI